MKSCILLVNIIVLSFFCSCKYANKRLESRFIDLKAAIDLPNKRNIDDYCRDVSYIKLETSDSVLLRSPSYLFTPNTIVAYESSSLYQFSYEGKFLNSYEKKGQGPMDLMGVNKVLWNSEREEIYVIDGALGKILILDEKLNFLDCMHFRLPAYRFVVNDDYIYYGLYRNDYRKLPLKAVGRFCILNGKNEMFYDSEFPYFSTDMYPMFSFGTKLSNNDTIFYFRENRSDSIFSFTPNDSTKRFAYKINVGNTYPPELDYNQNARSERKNYIIAGDCIFLDDLVFVSYFYKNSNIKTAVFHENSGKTFCLEESESNKIDGGLPIILIQKVQGRKFYAGQIIPSYHLTDDFISRVKKNDTSGELINILTRTTSEDNPILMFVELK